MFINNKIKIFKQFFWKNFIGFVVLLQIISMFGMSFAGVLKNVNLILDPPTVRRNQYATLRCIYELDNSASLYSVKFYRGRREFYRFSPSELPTKKIFPFPGINVDILSSNESQAVIKHVSFGISGNFSCEVTADAPYFSTATAYVHMEVVELPDSRPVLWSDREQYIPGDYIKAICSSPPSHPRAHLTLALNNIVIVTGDTQYLQTSDGLIASKTGFRIKLQKQHFGGPTPITKTSLMLRCIAQIENLYQEYSEMELGELYTDPIPERVTSANIGTKSKGYNIKINVLILIICIQLFL